MNIAEHNTIVLNYIKRAKRSNIVPHQISAATGLLLATLIRCMQAQTILEIGTLWGYSTWWLNQGCVGQNFYSIITLEKELKHYTLAKDFFTATNLTKVDLRYGDAIKLLPNFKQSQFDFIFLDADRREYITLLALSLAVLKSGGMLVIDNIQLNADQQIENLLQSNQRISYVYLAGTIELLLILKDRI